MSMAVHLNDCLPSSALPTNTLEAACIVAMATRIGFVLRTGCYAQIGDTIVAPIAIGVVNFKIGPFSVHIEPRQSMGKVTPAVDNNYAIPIIATAAGWPAKGDAGARYAPVKYAGPGVVVQFFSQSFRG